MLLVLLAGLLLYFHTISHGICLQGRAIPCPWGSLLLSDRHLAGLRVKVAIIIIIIISSSSSSSVSSSLLTFRLSARTEFFQSTFPLDRLWDPPRWTWEVFFTLRPLCSLWEGLRLSPLRRPGVPQRRFGPDGEQKNPCPFQESNSVAQPIDSNFADLVILLLFMSRNKQQSCIIHH
jgi:hypothetical protein